MSMTLAQMRDHVYAEGTKFAPQLQLPPQMVDQYIEYAQRFAFRKAILQARELQATAVTMADGDHLPADWFGFAGRAYYTPVSARVTFRWIPIEDLGTRSSNKFNQATASYPDLFFANQKLNTNPGTLSGITVFYYQRPPKLFGQADSTDLGLPDDLYPFVWRLAFLRAFQHYLDPARGFRVTEQVREENLNSMDTYNKALYAMQTKDERNQTWGG